MRSILALFIISSSVLASRHIVNYCGSKMCSHTNSHTFCQYNEGPGEACKGYMAAHLTTDEKARVMARLNQRRNAVASGRLPRFPTAGNMLKLRWVEELAREAQRWADQCQPSDTPERHDDCRDLYSITVGQCVASVVGEAPGLRPESMVDMWYMQNMHYKANVTSYEVSFEQSGYYDDFAQLIWAHSYMVGCGRSRFMTPWYSRLRTVERLVCNFAPRGPTVGRPLWTPAAPAAACPPRSLPDSQWTSLCSYQYDLSESHDVDNTMTLEEHMLLNTMFEVEKNDSLDYLGSMDELYLTNVAIATMANYHTTPWTFNSVRKRDTEELFDLLENKLNVEVAPNLTNQDINITNLNPNTTEKLPRSEKPIKLLKQKISLIGRPKSYNMEELNDVSGDQKTENHHDKPSEDMANLEKDLYAEYGFFETPEENTSTAMEEWNTLDTIENATQDSRAENKSTEIIDTTSETTSETTIGIDMLSSNLTVPVIKSYENNTLNETMEVNARPIEDYLSDPETVRILQEELDRMEQNFETSTNVPGKVRRELRQFPQFLDYKYKNGVGSEFPLESEQKASDTMSDRERRETENITDDTSPMLNMVLRYMPYLKDYKLADTSASTATFVSPSILLVLDLCLLFV